mgnify:CR=1 FL=1
MASGLRKGNIVAYLWIGGGPYFELVKYYNGSKVWDVRALSGSNRSLLLTSESLRKVTGVEALKAVLTN